MLKRLSMLCMALVMLVSAFALASCGLISDNVYKTLEKVCNAESLTVVDETDGIVMKMDNKKKIIQMSTKNSDGTTSDYWLFYQENEAKYYVAAESSTSGSYTKEEMTPRMFATTYANGVSKIKKAIREHYYTFDLWTKGSGVYYLNDEQNHVRSEFRVESGELIFTKISTDTATLAKESTTIVFSNIDSTKITIPQEVLNIE